MESSVIGERNTQAINLKRGTRNEKLYQIKPLATYYNITVKQIITLIEKARALLYDAKVEKKLCGEGERET